MYLAGGRFPGSARELPSSPCLPDQVTHLWVVSLVATNRIRWDGHIWKFFRALAKAFDDYES